MLENFYTKDNLRNLGNLVDIGKYTYGSPRILHWGEDAKLKIGKFCSIAEGTNIFLGGNHRYDWITTYPFSALDGDWPESRGIVGHPATRGDVIIGNDVWIGFGATIMSGVKIGDGAVIGAMSIITRDVSPYSIMVGNPAKEIKKRFNDDVINKLLEIQWWNWPEEKIRKNIGILCSNNLDKLV